MKSVDLKKKKNMKTIMESYYTPTTVNLVKMVMDEEDEEKVDEVTREDKVEDAMVVSMLRERRIDKAKTEIQVI